MRFRYSYRNKNTKLFANSGAPDQKPRSAASDLGLHGLPFTLLGVSRLQWVNRLMCGVTVSGMNLSFVCLC